MTTVVLIVGSRVFRFGLKLMLEEAGASIVGEFASVEELAGDVAKAHRGGRVVYLLKHDLSDGDVRSDLAALRAIDPEARIAVMCSLLAPDFLIDVFAAGGDGLILEEIGALALHESLNLVDLGEKVFPSQLASLLTVERRSADVVLRRVPGCPLTEREIEIVCRLTAGMANKEIANDLNLTVATVKVHVKSLLRKLGLNNRTQAAVWGLDAGLGNAPGVTIEERGQHSRHQSEIRPCA